MSKLRSWWQKLAWERAEGLLPLNTSERPSPPEGPLGLVEIIVLISYCPVIFHSLDKHLLSTCCVQERQTLRRDRH